MKPEDLDKLIEKYSILLDPDSELLPKNRKFNVSKKEMVFSGRKIACVISCSWNFYIDLFLQPVK